MTQESCPFILSIIDKKSRLNALTLAVLNVLGSLMIIVIKSDDKLEISWAEIRHRNVILHTLVKIKPKDKHVKR